MNFLRTIYRRLPVVKELIELRQSIGRLDEKQGVMREAAILHALQMLRASDPRYTDPERLLSYGMQYWSQNYEDGMIAEIFRRIQPATKTFLEIGVGNGSENNTAALLVQGWKGWWIEGNPGSCAHIRGRLAGMPAMKARLTLKEAYVSPSIIRDLIREIGVPDEIDLFSLDIDQHTYYIWDALPNLKPRVIVVEYNPALPPAHSWIQPYESGQMWDGSQAYGASLKAYEDLGRKLGYSLVGCDLLGQNAFFVRNDLVANKFKAPFTAENHYEPGRVGLLYHWGHPSVLFGESQGDR